jgi:hypothetical protein
MLSLQAYSQADKVGAHTAPQLSDSSPTLAANRKSPRLVTSAALVVFLYTIISTMRAPPS